MLTDFHVKCHVYVVSVNKNQRVTKEPWARKHSEGHKIDRGRPDGAVQRLCDLADPGHSDMQFLDRFAMSVNISSTL